MTALHKVNGLQGSLIVRVPKEYEDHYSLYDLDLPAHHLIIMDWYHTDPETRMPGLIHHDSMQLTTYYLLNGRGQYKVITCIKIVAWKNTCLSSLMPRNIQILNLNKHYSQRNI